MDLYQTSLESVTQSFSIIETPIQIDKSALLSIQNIIDISKSLCNDQSSKLSSLHSPDDVSSFECISNKSFSNLGNYKNKKDRLDHQGALKKLTFDLNQLQLNSSKHSLIQQKAQTNGIIKGTGSKELSILDLPLNNNEIMDDMEVNSSNANQMEGSFKAQMRGFLSSGQGTSKKRKLNNGHNLGTQKLINKTSASLKSSYKEANNTYDFLSEGLTFNPKIEQAALRALLKKRNKKQEGNYEAQEKYKSGIFVDPDSKETYYNWALGLQDKDSVLKQVCFNQGLALYKQGKCQKAIKMFKQAIYYNPSFYEAYYQWGLVLDTLGKYNESRLVYRKAVKLNPKFVEGHYRLGLVLYRLERYQEAIVSLEAVAAINSETDQLSLQGKVSEEISEKEEESSKENTVSEEYSILDKQDSLEHSMKSNPIEVNKENDSEKEFESLLDAILRMNIESRVPTEHLEAYSNNETIFDIVKGININPIQNMAYSLHGIILAKQGKFKEAIEKFEKTTSLDPSQCDVCFYWGLALCDQGEYEKAKEMFGRAAEMNSNYRQRYNDWVLGVKKEQNCRELLQRYMKVILLDTK